MNAAGLDALIGIWVTFELGPASGGGCVIAATAGKDGSVEVFIKTNNGSVFRRPLEDLTITGG